MAQVTVEFKVYSETDDIELFVTVSNVEDEKKVLHLFSGLGAKAYAVLKNLVVPQMPRECTMDRIIGLLINHFKSKPPMIAK